MAIELKVCECGCGKEFYGTIRRVYFNSACEARARRRKKKCNALNISEKDMKQIFIEKINSHYQLNEIMKNGKWIDEEQIMNELIPIVYKKRVYTDNFYLSGVALKMGRFQFIFDEMKNKYLCVTTHSKERDGNATLESSKIEVVNCDNGETVDLLDDPVFYLIQS